MKTITRNFFSTLRRFKIASLLNLLGLSVAFTAFIVIMIQVSFDLRFNSSIPNADNVYRINIIHEGASIAATPRPLGDGFAAYSPHVKAVAINNAMYATVFNRYFTIDSDDSDSQQQTYAEKMMETTSGYIDIFQPEMLEGDAQALLEPDNVLIPQSMSERLFKGESAIGKLLRGEDFVWTVGGVYKDFPKNSSAHNFILWQMPRHEHWALNYETYISIDPSQDANALFSEYIATLEPMLKAGGFNNVEFFLSPVKALHFETTIGFDTVAKTSKTQLWILIGIALVILLIAAINFTNYSIALAPLRVRSLNTQKVLGAGEPKLRISLTIEAVFICLTSFGIALFLVHLLSLTSVTSLLSSDLILHENIPLLFMVGARRFAYIRTKEGVTIYSAMQEIEKELQTLSPGFPFEIRSLDDISNDSYGYEHNIMILIALFSLLAILLSMIGVFGLVIFESEYKRREIGIRKVFGSTTKEILEMLNKQYVYLLIICFFIAAPLAYYGVNLWLQNFAYKTPMYWWVFAITFLLVAALTSATVTFQSWRVANANPADSIKTE